MQTYVQGAALPDLAIRWTDAAGNVIDFSTGYSFTVRVGKQGKPAEVEKTDGVEGAATDPNLTISWDAGELDPLTPGIWTVEIIATRDSDSRPRVMTTPISVLAGVSEATP